LHQPATSVAPIATSAVGKSASRITNLPVLACLVLAATVAASAEDRFNSAKLSQMDEAIERAIADHRLPGGVLWVERKGSNYHKAFGLRSVFPSPEAMTEDTIFDVASLTKVLATVPALMVLYERGKLKLEEPVVTYLPEFKGGGKEAITVRHLLTHTSGFGRGLGREPDWFDFKSAFKMVCAETPSEPPGAAFLYSDLNFIILGEVVQRLAGMRLDEFCAQELFKPLKMVDTGFLPSQALRARIAPTEKVGRAVLRGTVHDSKAQGMGGVAGHAGVVHDRRGCGRICPHGAQQRKARGRPDSKAGDYQSDDERSIARTSPCSAWFGMGRRFRFQPSAWRPVSDRLLRPHRLHGSLSLDRSLLADLLDISFQPDSSRSVRQYLLTPTRSRYTGGRSGQWF